MSTPQQRVHRLVLVALAIAGASPPLLHSQEPVRVTRPIEALDPHDPVRFPSAAPIRPHFEWATKDRFGLDNDRNGLVDYDYSLCYLHPEGGAPCPAYPWLVTFNATGTSGTNPPFRFDWRISGDVQCRSVIAARVEHTATLLPNGKVLIAGGHGPDNAPLSSADLYDPTTGVFAPTGTMAVARAGHSATLLPTGQVLIVGGAEIGPSAELYDPGSGAFTRVTSFMSARRTHHSATLLPNGQVLIAGGRSGSAGPLATAELFDTATKIFTPTAGNMSSPRAEHSATPLPNRRVLIAGGGKSGAAFAEVYGVGARTFTPITSVMSSSLGYHAATRLADGRVLITGGSLASAPYTTKAEVFNPVTNTFSPTTGRMTARRGHTATLLQDGRVLIVGGLSGNTTLATAELYDTAANAFSSTGGLSVERKDHAAALLANGRVVLAGGLSSTTYVSTGAAYDPAAGTFAEAGSSNIAAAVPDTAPFVDPPIIACAFAKQDTFPVTLKVKDGGGLVGAMSADVGVKDLLIVSIGNSVGSGEGNPDKPRVWTLCSSASDCAAKLRQLGATAWQIDHRTCFQSLCTTAAQWEDQQCHRSFIAGPALAAFSIERLDPHTSVTFLHLACSGASLATGLLGPYRGQEEALFVCPSAPVQGARRHCAERLGLTSNPPALNECPYSSAVPTETTYRLCYDLLPPQVDQVARFLCPTPLGSDGSGRITQAACPPGTGRTIDALLISAGANDIGFGQIVTGCALLLNCMLRVTSDGHLHAVNEMIRTIQNVGARLSELPGRYDALGQAVSAKLDPATVYLTQYFDPTGDENGYYCNPALANTKHYASSSSLAAWVGVPLVDLVTATLEFDGITTGELVWAFDNIITPLDQRLREAASRNRWVFVEGLLGAFFYHGVCASDNWVNGLKGSLNAQGNFDGTMHPNLFGQTAYQTRLVEALLAQQATLATPRQAANVIGLEKVIAHPTLAFRGLALTPGNQPPAADAGPDRTVRLGSLVTLNGSASSDPDAGPSPLAFSWAQTGGPTRVLTSGGTSTPAITFVPPVAGGYRFSLVVSDGQATSASDEVSIKVPVLGDLDLDGDVDRRDVSLLRAATNRRADGPNDLRDLDGDGRISAADVRLLEAECTWPRCATSAPPQPDKQPKRRPGD